MDGDAGYYWKIITLQKTGLWNLIDVRKIAEYMCYSPFGGATTIYREMHLFSRKTFKQLQTEGYSMRL